jgi:membrane associated rhomboid family serine protease
VFPLKDNIPTERFPVVTVALIALNVLVYFLLQDGTLGLPNGGETGDWPVSTYAYIPCEITGSDPCQTASGGPADWVTVFTAMFMHGSIVHLGGNMLFLWIFGNNVEDSMGRVTFVVFYLLGGIAATALQTVVSSGAEAQVANLGASGAVAAVLGGYVLLFPRARVITVIFIIFFFTIVELPALLILGFWFVQQALFGYFDLNSESGGGVAYFAHIGGFAFGLLTIKLFASERRRRRQIERVGGLT